jgi:hypothetical protein
MASIWDVPGVNVPATTPTNNWPTGGGGSNNGIWYNPSGNYGQSQDWYNSPIGENIREQDHSLAFSSWASRMGIPDNGNTFNQWLYQTQYPKFQQAYGMATMDNPLMTIDQFLQTLPNLDQLRSYYNQLGPQAAGMRYDQYAPNVRWITR